MFIRKCESNFETVQKLFPRFALVLALVGWLLGWSANIAYADIDLFVTVTDCRNGFPIVGAQVKVPTADTGRGSKSQAVTNEKGVAEVNPLRTEGHHTIEITAPGYQPKTISKDYPAWTTQEIKECLVPINANCNRVGIQKETFGQTIFVNHDGMNQTKSIWSGGLSPIIRNNLSSNIPVLATLFSISMPVLTLAFIGVSVENNIWFNNDHNDCGTIVHTINLGFPLTWTEPQVP